MRAGRRIAALAGALTLGLCAPACAFSNIDLVQDHRVHINEPASYSTVGLPLTIRWTASSTLAPDTQYAVFVDRTVIKPGASIRTVANGDRQCLANPACPTPTYLHDHDVYVVSSPQLTLKFLPDLAGTKRGISQDEHTITVVILNDGKRDGENAFSRTFYIRREASA
ncbi:MAG TPA: hypothetical protein VHC43_11990 [Mycobacteriales bacterium]|nr:hypothetical protein [Mycobacteriales bacterium]